MIKNKFKQVIKYIMHATFSFTNFHYHTFQLPLILNIWVKVKRNIREKKFSSYASSFFFFFSSVEVYN